MEAAVEHVRRYATCGDILLLQPQSGDDDFTLYRKRMMLGYKHRPNPLVSTALAECCPNAELSAALAE